VAIRGKERQLGSSFEKRLGLGWIAIRAWLLYGSARGGRKAAASAGRKEGNSERSSGRRRRVPTEGERRLVSEPGVCDLYLPLPLASRRAQGNGARHSNSSVRGVVETEQQQGMHVWLVVVGQPLYSAMLQGRPLPQIWISLPVQKHTSLSDFEPTVAYWQ